MKNDTIEILVCLEYFIIALKIPLKHKGRFSIMGRHHFNRLFILLSCV